MSNEYVVRVLEALNFGMSVSVDYNQCPNEEIIHIIRSAAAYPGRTVIIRNMPPEYISATYLRALMQVYRTHEKMHEVNIVIEV